MVSVIDTCRSCRASELAPFLSLGDVPLADGLVGPGDDPSLHRLYPLSVALCDGCGLVQIRENVPPEVLFGSDYPYHSSFSDELLAHSRRHVEALIAERELGPDNLVVEIGSNDGYLLSNVVEAGISVLGIDPSAGPVEEARARGVRTICEFFDPDVARRLRRDGVVADVVLGNNVLAHVPDPNSLVEGAAILLADDGIIEIEAPYLRDLVDNCEFDTIYHQHHCYFSATSISSLFERHGLQLVDVEHFDIHGGTLRYRFSRSGSPSTAVTAILAEEKAIGLDRIDYFRSFADRVERLCKNLVSLVEDILASGATIAGYGAAAKGSTLLAVAGLDARHIDYVVDRNVHKHGLLMPGACLAIRDPAVLLDEQPDYLLVLAWNFAEEIRLQQAEWEARGGRFIVPVPEPVVLMP